MKNVFRREPVWEKLDEKSRTHARSRESIGQLACGPSAVPPSALPPELTPHPTQDVAEDESTEERPHNNWENNNYYWVVICKNHRFHHKQSRSYNHKIPLGQTDAFEELPVFTGKLLARCDECGKEYSYQPAEVMRYELNTPESCTPHPLFK